MIVNPFYHRPLSIAMQVNMSWVALYPQLMTSLQQSQRIFASHAAKPCLHHAPTFSAFLRISESIGPAMEYLRQEHRDIYDEVADLLPDIPPPPAEHARRRRNINKARKLVVRAEFASRRKKSIGKNLSKGSLGNIFGMLTPIIGFLDYPLNVQLYCLMLSLAILFILTHEDNNQQG